jgi:uncharacterized protein (DUF4415 family)
LYGIIPLSLCFSRFSGEQYFQAKTEHLPAEFEQAAATVAPVPECVTVTLDIGADLLEWLKAQPLGWQHEINNTMRL